MRRVWLLTAALLIVASILAAPPAGSQQPPQNTLPNPTDFVPAGPHCQRRVNVSPWVGTPEVNWPKTFQCVLSIHTCRGVKTYRSAERPGGDGMCDDYWSVHHALANREICCDPGSREEKQQPLGIEEKADE
jgi:hypothetical protein